MTDPPGVSGIVLAGGRSTRFGSDKLAAMVAGRPLLHWPIAGLATVCAEVVVVVGPGAHPDLPLDLAIPVRIVPDDEPDAGPLAGLLSGLMAASRPVVVVAAGDMPALRPEVLRGLAAALRDPAIDAAALLDGDRLRPLPAALRTGPALAEAKSLRAAGMSRLRALFDGLRVAAIPEASWRAWDPDGSSLLDVDEPDDLLRLAP